MAVYACALVLSYLIMTQTVSKQVLDNGCTEKYFSSNKKALIAMLPLVLIIIFRWNVGVDSLYRGTYWTAYQNAKSGINLLHFQFLFFELMRLFASCSIPFFFFLAFVAAVFMGCSIYAIKRGSVSVGISVAVFFALFIFFDGFSSLRQSLTEAICMIVVSIILTSHDRKSSIIALALLALASGFHTIALMWIPVVLFSQRKFKQKTLLVIAAAAIAAYPLLQNLFRLIMRYFFSSKYSFIGVANYSLILTATVFLVAILFYNEICQNFEYGYVAVNISLVIFVIMLNSGALLLPYRCFDCLKIGYVFIIPMIVKGISVSSSRRLVSLAFLILFGYWFVNSFFIQHSAFAQYQSIFSSVEFMFAP